MPQLILILLVCGVAWFGYRKFVAEAERISRQSREREQEKRTGADGTLVQDPETGEYRVRREDE